jgi:4-amino-4-deoxy-L-arabinose transferase-like glycosyltransferase
VLALALGIRLLYLMDSSDNPSFDMPILDANTYHTLARSFAAASKMTEAFFWQAPFYPLFLSLFYKLFGVSVLGVKLLQALLGAATCLLACRLATQLYDRRTGLVAGLICCFYAPMIYFESELLATGWATFWPLLLLLLLRNFQRAPSRWKAVGLGVVSGLSAITRPVFFPFLWIMALILGVWIWRRNRALKPWSVQTACLLAGFLLVAVPVASWNKQLTGQARIRPYTGGVNFYIGNNRDYDEMINIRPGESWQALIDTPKQIGLTKPSEIEKYFVDQTKAYVKESPQAFFKGLFRKATEFFSAREIPRNTDIYLHREWSLMLRAGLWRWGRWAFPFGLLLPLALWGAIRRSPRSHPWLLLFVVTYVGSVVLVFVSARYRIPLIPEMSILAANGAVCMPRSVRRGAWKLLLVLAAGTMIGMATAHVPQDDIDYKAELYYYLGGGYNRESRTEEAVAAYQRAITERPDYLEARINLGALYMREGRLGLAERQFASALRAHPDDPIILSNLAGVLYQKGNFQEAETLYQRSLRLEPGVPLRMINLGLCFFRQGKLEAAKAEFGDVLRLDPGNRKARQLLDSMK